MIAIQTLDLTRKYQNKVAVHALNLSIKKGELFGLLGANGAGKTTTINMLTCLSKPTSGDALLLGDSIVENSFAVKGKIGVSPQETAIARNLTVKENLLFVARIYGSSKKEATQKADEMLTAFSLHEVARNKANTLSGGMQRRLSIALALISEPKILFLDEPTLGLDVIARRELWDLIRKLKGKLTIILTTHYMEEAEALCDRIGVMMKGNLKAVGTATELKELSGSNTLEEAFVAIVKEERLIG